MRCDYRAFNAIWTKCRPGDPTSSHWYDVTRLSRLIGAEIAFAQDRGFAPPTLRGFVSQFRGLSSTGTCKKIADALGATRTSLTDFYAGGPERVEALLDLMNAHSRLIKPADLGVIGRDHLAARFAEAGADKEIFEYRLKLIDEGGVPYVVEIAFAYAPRMDGR